MKILFFIAFLVSAAFAWKSYAPGEGPFDHMTNQEFAERYLMSLKFAPQEAPPAIDNISFQTQLGNQTHFDWRKTNASECISPIRNQGHCGSCWAHATSEMMSDRYCLTSSHREKIVFSPQFMVDCANSTWDAHGCDGADTQTAIHWMSDFGLRAEWCYPYFSGDNGTVGACYLWTCPHGWMAPVYNFPKNSIKLYNDYPNEEMAKDIKENGPIYFSMVVFSDFKSYKSGVYYPTSTEQLGTHAIKCIGWGYDDENKSYYWICANSWSTEWGEDGYFRIGFNQYIGYKAGSANFAYYTPISKVFSF
jgi:cathepsin B